MNALTEFKPGQVSTRFAGMTGGDDLTAGVQGGFGHIGYKGKVWSIRYRGQEYNLMREDGDGPRGSIEVVIIKASQAISKIWYENGYVEGANNAPDCFSHNGLHPDPSATKKQAVACAACQKNAWGSRVTPEGKKGKACSDARRVAVVPMNDITNEAFGGPLLLRIPAASLQDLAGYNDKMKKLGYPYFAIATRIAFDPQAAYPKFVFSAIRPLTDAEADLVLDLQKDPRVERVLASTEFEAPAQEALPPPAQVFEQPPQKPAVVPVTAPAQAAPAAAPAPAAVTPPVAGGFGAVAAVTSKVTPQAAPAAAPTPDAFEKSLDGRLANLLG